MACPQCGYDNIDLHFVCRVKAERRAEKAQAAISAAQRELVEMRAENSRLRAALGHNEDVAACAEFHELRQALDAIRRVSQAALRGGGPE